MGQDKSFNHLFKHSNASVGFPNFKHSFKHLVSFLGAYHSCRDADRRGRRGIGACCRLILPTTCLVVLCRWRRALTSALAWRLDRLAVCFVARAEDDEDDGALACRVAPPLAALAVLASVLTLGATAASTGYILHP